MALRTLDDWVDHRQAHGRYSFVRSEALAESGLSPESVKKALQRLARRGRIVKAKAYFFVIVPLEYASAGSPPASWFIHDLMGAMQRPYYVGLLTAAGLYGASHHQPQEFQVVTDRPVRSITAGRVCIRFFTSRFVSDAAMTDFKTPTGAMRVSTPETTAVDLVRLAKAAGQLDHAASVMAELASRIDAKKLVAVARAVGDVPNAQRLGFILDRVRARRVAEPLRSWIERQSPKPVSLRSGHHDHDAREDRRWHVLVDRPLDIET